MERSQRTKRNIGLEILRMLLCFYVLLFHCLKQSHSGILNFILSKKFHVPSFFFISFYYFFPIIKERNIIKMKMRLERLFIPYIIWPICTWLFNNLLYLIFKINRFKRILSFKDIFLQLITGRKFFVQFWYLFNLLFFSIFFFIISAFQYSFFLIFIKIICILSYVFQYSKYKYFFYHNYHESIAFSIWHFPVSFPIAVTAFIFNIINFVSYAEKYRYQLLLIIIILLPFIFIFGMSFTYYGIDKNIFSILI